MHRQIFASGRRQVAAIADLHDNTNYTFMIAGVNDAGVGPFSSAITLVTPGGKHVVPSIVQPS